MKKYSRQALEQYLEQHIPYRLSAVGTMILAMNLREQWGKAPAMSMYIEEKLVIDGSLNAFTNPAIEAGVVHCRALLQFLGVGHEKGVALINIDLANRNPSDVGIEHFLPTRNPPPLERLLSRYPGNKADAESAFLAVFHAANKSLAHVTSGFEPNRFGWQHLKLGAKGVIASVHSELYIALGREPPKLTIKQYRANGS